MRPTYENSCVPGLARGHRAESPGAIPRGSESRDGGAPDHPGRAPRCVPDARPPLISRLAPSSQNPLPSRPTEDKTGSQSQGSETAEPGRGPLPRAPNLELLLLNYITCLHQRGWMHLHTGFFFFFFYQQCLHITIVKKKKKPIYTHTKYKNKSRKFIWLQTRNQTQSPVPGLALLC